MEVIKMKTKYLAIFAMLLLVIPMAFAQEENLEQILPIDETEMDVEEIELEEPGILPDSPFYGLGRAMERLQMAFTFGEANKLELGLKHAEKRLSEARTMIQKEKTEKVRGLLEEYNQDMEQVREKVNQQFANCEDIESADCQKMAQIMEHVSERTMKHIAVLQGVSEKVPEQARNAIQNAMNKSIQNHTEAMQRFENRFREMEQNQIGNGIGEPGFGEQSNGMPEDIQQGGSNQNENNSPMGQNN